MATKLLVTALFFVYRGVYAHGQGCASFPGQMVSGKPTSIGYHGSCAVESAMITGDS